MSSRRSCSPRAFAAAGALLVFLTGAASADPPLRRDPASYFIFAMRHAHLKNFILQGSCNVGVNCSQPAPGSECGVVSQENPIYGDGSQIAGDVTRFTKPGGTIWQLFRNDGSPLVNVTIRHPGSKPDGSDPLVPLPILHDLDGDGQASCRTTASGCIIDAGDAEKLCGFPSPFPTCDASRAVSATLGHDCAFDSQPGNGACELAPGTYGTLTLANDALVTLAGPGSYTFCGIQGGRRVKLFGVGAVVHIPGGGRMTINNSSAIGPECGDLRVLLQGTGEVMLGRHVAATLRVCAPESLLRLGHGNTLRGQFIGDVVDADDGDTGQCCAGRCACFDDFAPMQATIGQTIALTSGCDLSHATAVSICGIPATIVAAAPQRLDVMVPAGASGSCAVEVESPAGWFVHANTLTVL